MKNETRIRLADVNEFITCVLCKGYLIDATTITECLHTFCKKCIVDYLEDHCNCPICDTLLHQSHPYLFIAHDRTMQSIVYSLVSNLERNELDRQVKFYKENNLEYPPQLKEILEKQLMSENNPQNRPASNQQQNNDHRNDEQIQLCLEPLDGLKKLQRRYLLCSCESTVNILKKYVAQKIFLNQDKYKELDIVYGDQLLGREHTLKFIQVTYKKDKNELLRLHFRPKMDYH